jgi:hypothetical protein
MFQTARTNSATNVEKRPKSGWIIGIQPFPVVQILKVRGSAGSLLLWETMATGGVVAARPRSTSQTSPPSGFIDDIQYVLFDTAGAGDIENIEVGEFDEFEYALANAIGGVGQPGLEFGLEFLKDEFHCCPGDG